MILYLRYNRWAQFALLVVIVAAAAGGLFLSKALRQNQQPVKTTTTVTDEKKPDTKTTAQPDATKNTGPKVGEIEYTQGTVKLLSFVAGQARPITEKDSLPDIPAVAGGFDLRQRSTAMAPKFSSNNFLHKESVVDLIDLYTAAAESVGYTVTIDKLYGDLNDKSPIRDPRYAYSATLGLDKRDKKGHTVGGLYIRGVRPASGGGGKMVPAVVTIITSLAAPDATPAAKPTTAPAASAAAAKPAPTKPTATATPATAGTKTAQATPAPKASTGTAKG